VTGRVTRRDPYAGQDLLADVFEGTELAPEPLRSRDCSENLINLYASPDDPRWTVDVWLHSNGDVAAVQSIRPSEETRAHAPTRSEPSTAVSGPGNGNGGEA
jgi:hypothetical protein